MAELVIRVSALRLAHAKHTRGPKDTHLTLSKQPHDWSHITTVKQIIWFNVKTYTCRNATSALLVCGWDSFRFVMKVVPE